MITKIYNKIKNNKKILSLVLITLLLVSALIYHFNQSHKTQAAKRLLYYGSRNSDVRILQWKLQQWGYYDNRIDGVYGADTWAAVREFQSRNGLRVDGIVGPETWGALGYEYRNTTSQTSQRSAPAVSTNVNRSDNVELIARLIHAEARGEPYEGQVAVGAVLLNRVESPSFPNSISGVIYQPLAFESVANGQFNRSPTSENVRAARAAINGWDPVYGALFFWNPSKPVNRWIWSRSTIRTIGDHIFAR